MKKRLQNVINNMKLTNNNVTQAAKLEGYSDSYANTLIHKTIRKYIGVKSDDEIKEEFLIGLDKDVRRFKKEKDNSNYIRTKELKSKILGLQLDKSEIRNVNPDKIVIAYNTKSPTENINNIKDDEHKDNDTK